MTNKIYLYHYKPLSSLEHFSHLQNFVNKKIWFTRLDEFNDPFEGDFDFKYATGQEILDHSLILNDLFNHLKLLDPELKNSEITDALKSHEAAQLLGTKESIRDFFKAHGAFCLTSSDSNIPMWAHYAKNHTGYCIIFEIDFDDIYKKIKVVNQQVGNTEYTCEEFNQFKNRVFYPDLNSNDREILSFHEDLGDETLRYTFTKINYSEIRPIVESIKISEHRLKQDVPEAPYNLMKYMSNNSFGVKFKQWAYENEYRLLVNSNSKDLGLWNSPSFIKIKGIIMGCNIGKSLDKDAVDFIHNYELSGFNFKNSVVDEKVKEFIANLANQHGMKIYLAECSSDEYKIITDKEFIR